MEDKPSVSLQHYIEKMLEERDKAVRLAVSEFRWMVATAIATLALVLALIALFWRR